MDSKRVVESLLYYSINTEHLRKSLILARVISDDRPWTQKESPELRAHLREYEKPSVLVIIGLTITVFVISGKSKNKRLLNVVTIKGKTSMIGEISKGKLIREAASALNEKDFMPVEYSKQIIWIPFKTKESIGDTSENVEMNILSGDSVKSSNTFNEDDLVVFTEDIGGYWSIDPDVSKPDMKMKAKTNRMTILRNIIGGIEIEDSI